MFPQIVQRYYVRRGGKIHVCKELSKSVDGYQSYSMLSQCRFFETQCTHTQSHTHTHLFNSPLSVTTWVSRYQKGKTNLNFNVARDSEWQWHQLGHVQICTLLQADNHASNPSLSFFTGWMPFLPINH